MNEIEEIKKELAEIKERNRRVELDKAWETSLARKSLIAILTYIVVVIFFYIAKLGNPFVNAIVPTIGFLLSTLSISIFKTWWVRNK
jgi:polyferredoxin